MSSVSCIEEHEYEVLPTARTAADCSRYNAVTYLGGVVGVDVLTPAVRTSFASDRCMLRAPAPQVARFRDVLQQPVGAAWRDCYDALRRQQVSCSQPHTGEFLGASGEVPATNEECREPASEYLGQPFSLFEDRLGVTNVGGQQNDPTAGRCLIRTKSPRLAIPVILRNTEDVQFDLVAMR